MVFRMLQNGARADLNDFATAAVNPATGARRSGTTSWARPARTSCSRCRRTASPRRRTSTPAASGYLRSIWNGTATGTGAGTLTGPDADGYYTVTLTGVTIPDSAVMLTGGLGYSYNVTSTLPLTQTNLAELPGHARHGDQRPDGHACRTRPAA